MIVVSQRCERTPLNYYKYSPTKKEDHARGVSDFLVLAVLLVTNIARKEIKYLFFLFFHAFSRDSANELERIAYTLVHIYDH